MKTIWIILFISFSKNVDEIIDISGWYWKSENGITLEKIDSHFNIFVKYAENLMANYLRDCLQNLIINNLHQCTSNKAFIIKIGSAIYQLTNVLRTHRNIHMSKHTQASPAIIWRAILEVINMDITKHRLQDLGPKDWLTLREVNNFSFPYKGSSDNKYFLSNKNNLIFPNLFYLGRSSCSWLVKIMAQKTNPFIWHIIFSHLENIKWN